MTAIKVFYNTLPGQKINGLEHEFGTWEHPPYTSFHHILNTLGIQYEWSNDPKDSIVVLDIGSTPYETQKELVENLIEDYISKYGKTILFTSQEPIHPEEIHNVLNKYPDLFVMDIRLSNNPTHERYIPFPSLFARLVNPFCNVIDLHPTIDTWSINKPNTFNNLKWRWTPDKFATQYAINKSGVESDAIISYQRPGEHWQRIDLEESIWSITSHRSDMTNFRDKEFPNIMKFLDNMPTISLQDDKDFNVLYRYHPKYIYDDTYFTLVNENFNYGVDDGQDACAVSEQYFYISEKIIYPMIQGHPIIILGNPATHYMLDQLGFEVYDEILSYDHDLLTYGMDRINRACDNIKDFDVANYEIHIEQIHKKIQHNQRLLTNTNSSLWVKLRQTMETNIGKYYDI
jgi:hypothetical protein